MSNQLLESKMMSVKTKELLEDLQKDYDKLQVDSSKKDITGMENIQKLKDSVKRRNK